MNKLKQVKTILAVAKIIHKILKGRKEMSKEGNDGEVEGIKPGNKTSELSAEIITVLLLAAGTLADKIPAEISGIIVGILSSVYIISRTWLKVKVSKDNREVLLQLADKFRVTGSKKKRKKKGKK